MDAALYEQVLRAGLGDGNTMAAATLNQIVKAATGHVRRHVGEQPPVDLGSAPNLKELCSIVRAGIFDSLWRIPSLCTAGENDPEYRSLFQRNRALYQFAMAARALIDFYFLTNWVEIARVGTRPAPTAEVLPTKAARSIRPSELPSTIVPGVSKESPTTGHGAERAAPGPKTWHEIALDASTRAVAQLWKDDLHNIFIPADPFHRGQTYDREAVYAKLAWGGDRTCVKYWDATGTIDATSTHVFPDGETLHGKHHITGLVIKLDWKPTRYPGPSGSTVEADVFDRDAYIHGEETSTTDGNVNTHPAAVELTVKGKVKVTPKDEPLELVLTSGPTPLGPPMFNDKEAAFSLKLHQGKTKVGPFKTMRTIAGVDHTWSWTLNLELT